MEMHKLKLDQKINSKRQLTLYTLKVQVSFEDLFTLKKKGFSIFEITNSFTAISGS